MRIISAEGRLLKIEKAVKVIEQRLNFNGEERRLIETVEDKDVKANALALEVEAESFGFGGLRSHPEIFIGNFSPDKCDEIMRELLEKGYYDFSALDYQKAKKLKNTVLDDGKSLPYRTYSNIWPIGNFCNSSGFGFAGDGLRDCIASPFQRVEFGMDIEVEGGMEDDVEGLEGE